MQDYSSQRPPARVPRHRFWRHRSLGWPKPVGVTTHQVSSRLTGNRWDHARRSVARERGAMRGSASRSFPGRLHLHEAAEGRIGTRRGVEELDEAAVRRGIDTQYGLVEQYVLGSTL